MKYRELKEVSSFLAEYAACLLGSGVHTSRTERNTKRIGLSLGTDVHLNLSMKTMTLTVRNIETGESITEVIDVPHKPIKFFLNSELSALSWEVHDRSLNIDETKQRYDEILLRSNRQPFWVAWLLISLSNACFCRLFEGDYLSMLIVAIASAMGFYTRHFVVKKQINLYIAITLAATVSSGMAVLGGHILPTLTSATAVATSVLYLIPGVPLINGIIDIVEGHTLSGVSRLIQGGLIVLSISSGMAITLLLTTGSVS